VDFAFRDRQVDALEDFGAIFEGGLEVLDSWMCRLMVLGKKFEI
jgi:hypothetical protein